MQEGAERDVLRPAEHEGRGRDGEGRHAKEGNSQLRSIIKTEKGCHHWLFLGGGFNRSIQFGLYYIVFSGDVWSEAYRLIEGWSQGLEAGLDGPIVRLRDPLPDYA